MVRQASARKIGHATTQKDLQANEKYKADAVEPKKGTGATLDYARSTSKERVSSAFKRNNTTATSPRGGGKISARTPTSIKEAPTKTKEATGNLSGRKLTIRNPVKKPNAKKGKDTSRNKNFGGTDIIAKAVPETTE